LSGFAALKVAQGAPRKRISQALDRIIALYEAWGMPEKAAGWRAKKLALPHSAENRDEQQSKQQRESPAKAKKP
jgi:hypothetical protein